MANDQQGDVKLIQTADDGDLASVTNGLVEMSGGLETAAYLSLFGGNIDDDGSDDTSLSYWQNIMETQPERQYRSQLQYQQNRIPLTTANLVKFEEAAYTDLQWFLTQNIASEVTVTASIPGVNRLKLVININAEGELSEFEFTENWEADIGEQEAGSVGTAPVVPTPDPDTVVLLSMTGTNGSTSFPDTALGGVTVPHVMTAINSAQITTSLNDPFGNNVGVGQFVRASNDRLETPVSADFHPTADMAIEMFINHDATVGGQDYFFSVGSDWAFGLLWNGSIHVLQFAVAALGIDLRDTVDYSTAGSWTHIAASRVGNVWNLYNAGTRVATTTQAGSLSSVGTNYVGNKGTNPGFASNTKMSNYRISTANRGYTGASLTVPTAAFTPYL